jgi:hypothetical protein
MSLNNFILLWPLSHRFFRWCALPKQWSITFAFLGVFLHFRCLFLSEIPLLRILFSIYNYRGLAEIGCVIFSNKIVHPSFLLLALRLNIIAECPQFFIRSFDVLKCCVCPKRGLRTAYRRWQWLPSSATLKIFYLFCPVLRSRINFIRLWLRVKIWCGSGDSGSGSYPTV